MTSECLLYLSLSRRLMGFLVSLVVILFEVKNSWWLYKGLSKDDYQLTGALSHVLPIMISVMTSKWVGDALGKDGIYAVWIAMRRYPWLPPVDYRDRGETGATLMKPLGSLFVIEDGKTTVKEMIQLLKKHDFHGFPVVDRHSEFVGYATREELQLAICSSFIPAPSRFPSSHYSSECVAFRGSPYQQANLHIFTEPPTDTCR